MAEPRAWWTDPVQLRQVLGRHVPQEDGLPEALPPFRGGYAGLFGYGFGQQFERIPDFARNPLPTTDVAVGRYDWVYAWDHVTQKSWWIGESREQWHEIEARSQTELTYGGESQRLNHDITPLAQHAQIWSDFSRPEFESAIRQAMEYVHAGDVFQVNIAQRLLARQTVHPWVLYEQLRRENPAPFAVYLNAGDFQVVSASPERFLKVDRFGNVSTKPIKGTRPRGKTAVEDEAIIAELRSSPKDHAENVMIVDLLRNDLGRVCDFGTVYVHKVCALESYAYVHHLVSEVRGQLTAGRSAFDLLCAAFPGGSVTGAPKVRAMEIIAELEPSARGPYCGSIGFLSDTGAMDTNILIRTFTVSSGWLQFPVGGGIVADSVPEREYEETLHKARGLLRTLEVLQDRL
jgi:para-aminobenzoate synthetase component 1